MLVLFLHINMKQHQGMEEGICSAGQRETFALKCVSPKTTPMKMKMVPSPKMRFRLTFLSCRDFDSLPDIPGSSYEGDDHLRLRSWLEDLPRGRSRSERSLFGSAGYFFSPRRKSGLNPRKRLNGNGFQPHSILTASTQIGKMICVACRDLLKAG